MTAPRLVVDNFRLLADGVDLGAIHTHEGTMWLTTHASLRLFLSPSEFQAEMTAHPEVALRQAEVAMAAAHFALNESVGAARRGDRDGVQSALARCDARITLAKAWLALAGYDPA